MWVECPYELRLARGVARDGEAMRVMWGETWMLAEERFVRAELPHERVDFVVAGARN